MQDTRFWDAHMISHGRSMEQHISLANEYGRRPEIGRNLGISQSRQSKEHTMLKVEIVNASQQCSNNMKKKKLMGMEMG